MDMRRKILIALTLVASMCLYPIGTVASAGEMDEGSVSGGETLSGEDLLSGNISENLISENVSENLISGNVSENLVSGNVSENSVSENVSENKEGGASTLSSDAESKEKTVSSDERDISFLQIPEKLSVTIDPLEVDGKGQIYSEKYSIRNDGKTAGVLRLYDLRCKLRKGSSVILRKDTKGLHEGEEQSIYMEILFGDADRLTLTQKASEYETELEPGEELPIRFTGEVNENAPERWANQGISINISYSWKLEEEKPERARVKKEAEAEPEEEVSENDTEVEETMLPTEGAEEDTEEEYERINVTQIAPEKRLSINSWKADEEGDTESAAYILRNDGEEAGTLTISGPMYGMPEEEDTESVSENGEDSLSDNEEETVQLRLLSGNNEKFILSQGSAGYKVRLEPGEEASVRFTRESDEQPSEEWPDEEESMTVLYSWDADIEELIYEEENEMPEGIGIEEKDEKPEASDIKEEDEKLEEVDINEKGEEPEKAGIDEEDERPEEADREEGVSENDGTGTDTAGS